MLWCVLVRGRAGSAGLAKVGVFLQNERLMLLAEHDSVVGALAEGGPDPSLAVAVLPGRGRRDPDFADIDCIITTLVKTLP